MAVHQLANPLTDTLLSGASPLPHFDLRHQGENMSSTKDPCISLCKFNEDICVGCGRSKREIRAWKKLDKADKRTVLAEAELRLLALGATGRRKSK